MSVDFKELLDFTRDVWETLDAFKPEFRDKYYIEHLYKRADELLTAAGYPYRKDGER